MKKILSILLLAIGLVSCDDVEKDNPVDPVDPVTPDVEYEITDIVITGSGITAEGTVTLAVGTTLELDVEITPTPEEALALVWTTCDEALLSISSSGVVEAKKAGTVKVTVTPADYPDVSATITVTIVDGEVTVGDGKADQSVAEAR